MAFQKYSLFVYAGLFLCVVLCFFLALGGAERDSSGLDEFMQMAESENDRNLLRELYVKFENMPIELRTDEMKLRLLEEAIPKFDSQVLKSFLALQAGKVLTEQGNDSGAQRYNVEAMKSEHMAPFSCSFIPNQYMNQGKFKEALVCIDQCLKNESIPEALRIELKCHRLRAMLALGYKLNLEGELNAIEVKQPENRVEFFQRLQRIASDQAREKRYNEALEIMDWLQTKMTGNELNPNFLNSFAFFYEEAGYPDKEREKRLLLLDKFPETEDAIWQMSILTTQYMKENNLVSAHLAKNLLERILSHPKASDDYKKRAESSLGVVNRSIENGFPNLDRMVIEEEVKVYGETVPARTPPERDRPRYLALRITCIVVGIVLILWGLYLAWTKEKKEI